MSRINLKHTLYFALLVCMLLFSGHFLILEATKSDWHDFDVFLNSAKAALEGKSIYIVTGKYDLPFWYLPWTAWFFIPFTIWPRTIALGLYIFLSGISLLWVVNSLVHYYNPKFATQDLILMLALIVPMTLQLVIVGQMDYILLGFILLTMYAIEEKREILAGLLFPILWIKPHLFIVFTLFGLWRAGKRAVLVSAGSSIFMLTLETLLHPGWMFEMFNLLSAGTQRTKGIGFTTLPNLLGSQENWVGTANLPFTILLILLAILIVWKFRSLPTYPLLSLALAASLFCAPRALAYDLTLLIPPMIWLTAQNFRTTFWLWIIGAIIPVMALYSVNAYIVTLIVFILSIKKAYDATKDQSNLQQAVYSTEVSS